MGNQKDYVPPGSASIVDLDIYRDDPIYNYKADTKCAFDKDGQPVFSFKSNIKYIIQAAPAVMLTKQYLSKESVKNSVYNCLYLANKFGVTKIAFPIIGGNIFFQALNITKNGLYTLLLEGVSEYFNDFNASSIVYVLFAVGSQKKKNDDFEATLATFFETHPNVKKIVDFSDKSLFTATDTYNESNSAKPITALVNAANMQLEFGGGISQGFREKVFPIFSNIDAQGKQIISDFYSAKNLYLKDATINPTPSPIKPDPDFVPPAPLPPPQPQPPPVVTGGQRYSNAELVTSRIRVTNEVDTNSYNNTNKEIEYDTKSITKYKVAYWASNSCFFDGFLMIFLIHRNTFLFDTLFYNDNEEIRKNIHKIVDKMDKTDPYNLGEYNETNACFVPEGVLVKGGVFNDSQIWLQALLQNIYSKAAFVKQEPSKNPKDAIENECNEFDYIIRIPSDHENTTENIAKISKFFNTTDLTIKSRERCNYKIQNYNFPIIFQLVMAGFTKGHTFLLEDGITEDKEAKILPISKTQKQLIPDEALIINNFIYELIGINTKGGSGHYVYFIKDPESLTWYFYDDGPADLKVIGAYTQLIGHQLIKENTLNDDEYHIRMYEYNKARKQLKTQEEKNIFYQRNKAPESYGNSYTFIYYPNKLMVQHHKALNTLKDKFKQTLKGEQVNLSNYTLIGTKISGEYLKLCCNIGIANANIIRQIHTSIPERQGKKIEQKNITEISNIFQQQKGKADPVQSMIDQYGQKLAIFYDNADYVIYNERWSRLLRQCVLQETLCAFASTFDTMTYHEIAHYNMIRFKEKSQWKEIEQSEPTFGIIKVIKSDTLDAALCATKIFGEMFTVLNMANATGFGGGYTHGRSAQEENIFRRTDCHFSMRREHLSFKRPGKYKYTYQYEDDGNLTMTERINRGIVFKDQPRVCIRRGESLVPSGNISPVKILQLIHYKWLDYYDIFQFYEMRNAARDYRDEDYNPFYIAKKDKHGKDDNTTKDPISDAAATALYNEVDKEIKAASKLDKYVKDAKEAALQAKGEAKALFETGKAAVEEAKKTMALKDVEALEDANKKKLEPLEEKANEALLKEIVSDMKTRIINQLAQLIKNNCEYVILSAFGCGAFHNHPIVVSNLYKEIFESVYDKVTPTKTYREHFKVIIFAIYQNNPQVDNSSQFKILENIKTYPLNVQALFDELQALLTQLDFPDPSPPP